MTASSMASPYILFIDHKGHVAPIGHCYHATASRRLSSSVERHPPSTQTEIDSAYCPNCLSFHDAASASQLGYCPKITCQQCPRCQSSASVTLDNSKCYFKCGYCDWNSLDIGLFALCTDENQIEAATEALGSDLAAKRSKKDAHDLYQSTLQTLEAVVVEHLRLKKQPNHVYKDPDTVRQWSMETLTQSLEAKAVKPPPASKGVGQEIKESPKIPIHHKSVVSLLLSPDLLPLPVALRPRKSRRCRAELEEGRPGILVKPKLNPLEGDTSLRSGHGQWYKKDSSAILVLPRVRIERSDQNAVLLSVHNPTLGPVKLSLESSSYVGEPVFEDPIQRTTELKHILVDSLRGTILNRVTLDTSFQLPSSGVVTLEAVEEAFLDLGGSDVQLPKDVQHWSASEKMGWIAQKGDMAWFAFDAGDSECIALALKIVVTKGSWESSLIKPNGVDDAVTFDMVLIRSKQEP